MLVVDDDEHSRLAAQALLEDLGFSVDLADNGREALRRCAQWPYVGIFMDCGKPDIDGYAAAREIRRLDGASP